MRAVFLVLLSANLLFLAWARWIDGPRDTGAQDSLARLPRLQLVTESPRAPRPKRTSANSISSNATLVASSLRIPDAAQTSCTSVGPFNDIASAARAAGLLIQRGFRLQQRAEEGEAIEGYWVFVGGMQSDEEVSQVVAQLGKSGFTDAHIMKNYSTNRRVSVGLFSTRERAEKRAAAVKNMGLQPEIGERKFPGTIYWVDVALEHGSGRKQLPDYAIADIGHAKVETQPCPAGLRPTDPDAPTPLPRDDTDGAGFRLPRTTVASAPARH